MAKKCRNRALLTILLLCASAVGQTSYAGSGASIGLAMIGMVASGAPLMYAA